MLLLTKVEYLRIISCLCIFPWRHILNNSQALVILNSIGLFVQFVNSCAALFTIWSF